MRTASDEEGLQWAKTKTKRREAMGWTYGGRIIPQKKVEGKQKTKGRTKVENSLPFFFFFYNFE